MDVNIWKVLENCDTGKIWGYGKIDSRLFTFWGYPHGELSFKEHVSPERCHQIMRNKEKSGFVLFQTPDHEVRLICKQIRADFLKRTLKGELNGKV